MDIPALTVSAIFCPFEHKDATRQIDTVTIKTLICISSKIIDGFFGMEWRFGREYQELKDEGRLNIKQGGKYPIRLFRLKVINFERACK